LNVTLGAVTFVFAIMGFSSFLGLVGFRGFVTWFSVFSFTELTPSLIVVFLDQGIHL
jgi:hypothetical protein